MSTSSGYQPKPTIPTPTGMHQVVPNRGPSIVAVRQGFEATFGAYVPPDWTLDAECTQPGTDPEMFYPTRGGANRRTKEALALCASCIVREKCLEEALAYESGEIPTDQARAEAHGVRGGMTEKARRGLLHQRLRDAEEKAKAGVLEDYEAGALKVKEIALKHSVTEAAVTRWAAAAGLELRPQLGGVPRKIQSAGGSR
jgi:hypothetical protein